MVKKHMRQPFQFVCVADSRFRGWWAKIDLFKPGRFKGRVLYLDLDVTVTGNLDEIVAVISPFALIKDWGRIGYNSSVMVWDAGYRDAGYADRLYTEFNASENEGGDMARPGGDQSYIWHKMHGEATFPKHWCRSFKRIVLLHEPTDDMRVCVFHGRPKPWEVEVLV